MAAPPHPYWPEKGSVWAHWSDALVAMQLAACRAGFTSLSRVFHLQTPNVLHFKCAVQLTNRRKKRCTQTLVSLKPVDLSAPQEAVRVSDVKECNLEAQRHPDHVGGIGVSFWLQNKPDRPLKLKVGADIVGYRALHTLEGSLRVAARQEGRYLASGVDPDPSGKHHTYGFSCVLDTQRCTFLRVSLTDQRFGYFPVSAAGSEPVVRSSASQASRTSIKPSSIPSPAPRARPSSSSSPFPSLASFATLQARSALSAAIVARSVASDKVARLASEVSSLRTMVEEQVVEADREGRVHEGLKAVRFALPRKHVRTPICTSPIFSTLSSSTSALEDLTDRLEDSLVLRKACKSKERRARKRLVRLLEAEKEKKKEAALRCRTLP
ncbi:hypothetical protein JCM6882_001743 [Rhodosporidiobolus microsporus]